MNALVLSEDEIRDLTKRVHYSSQSKVLTKLGIEHRARPDGSLVVSRTHAEQVLGAKPGKKKSADVEPNWGALHAARA